MIHIEGSKRLAIVLGLAIVLLQVIMYVGTTHAATASYTLEDVILEDLTQITGTFDWTYAIGDFEGGSGVFTTLEIPWRPGGSVPPLEQEGMVFTIEDKQIEISLDGNYHDFGLDIILKFPLNPLSPTESSPIDTDPLTGSFFECCGNGFKDQPFISGSISPKIDLIDAIIGLQLMAGINLTAINVSQTDFNTDGRIDMADVVYILQKVSGLR